MICRFIRHRKVRGTPRLCNMTNFVAKLQREKLISGIKTKKKVAKRVFLVAKQQKIHFLRIFILCLQSKFCRDV
jgi:hypothetical protein